MKFKKLMVTLLTAVLMVMTILPYVSFAKDLSQVIEVIPGKEPTCTEPGYLGYNLLADGSFMSGNVVFGMEDEWKSYGGGGYLSPTGHDWSDVKDPTCTEDGYERCTKCGAENTLPMLCHIYALDEDDSYAPTCIDDGLEVYRCEECGMTYAEPIPATGKHDYKLDELMSYKPNCETAGLNTYECTVCGKTYTEEIPALGGQHNYEVSYEFEGTCTEEAYTTYKCTICKNEYTVRGTMKDHNWVLTEEGDKATCTTVGHDVYECTECHGKKWIEIPATGHTKVTDEGYLPTCEEEGLSDGQHCSVCGQVLIKQSPIPRTGHDFYTTEKVITKQPTHTEKGTYTYQVLCTKCDFTSTINEDILPVKKHIPVTDEGYSSTCWKEGLTEGSHCSICGEVIVAQEVIPTTDDHTYKTIVTATCLSEGSEYCTECGYTRTVPKTECKAAWNMYGGLFNYKSASCGWDGGYDIICKWCHKIMEHVTYPATGEHAYRYIKENEISGTCTSNASYDWVEYCGVCREVFSTEHVEVECSTDPDNHPTLTLTGMNEYYEDGEFLGFKFTFTCQDCGAQKYSYVYHYGYDAGYPATCVKDGLWPLCAIVDKFGWWDEDCGEIELTRVNGVWELTNIYMDNDVIPATGKHNFAQEGYKAPTCTEEGSKFFMCVNCGYSYTETIPKTDHSFTEYMPDFNATCDTDGTKTAKCDYCDVFDTIVDEGTATGSHAVFLEETVPATCTEDGYEKYKCYDCDYYYTTPLYATGEHNWVTVTEPACLYKGKQKCTVCGKEEIIPPTGVHDYQLIDSCMPTCGDCGYYEYKCSICGHTYSEILDGTGEHDFQVVYSRIPTCEDFGIYFYKCSVCGCWYHSEIIPPTGVHNFTEYISNNDATCVTDGTKTAHCIWCNACDTIVDEGTATGQHHVHIKIENRVPATCTETGSLDIVTYCTICGEELSTDHIETAPTGHTEVTREENNKPATCSTNRSYDLVTYCAVCKEVISTEHKVVEGKTLHTRVVDPAVEATCTHTGLTEGQHCSVCGEVFIAQEVVEKKAHVIIGTIGCSAGCLHEGWSCKMCKNCDEEIDLVTTPALGHNYEFLKMTRTLMADYEDEIGTNYIIGGGQVLDFGSGNIYEFYRCSRCRDTYYKVIGKLNTSAPAPAVTEPETEPDDGLIRKRDTVTAPTTTVEEETTTIVEAPKLNGWVHIGQKWYHYVDGVRTTTWDWYAENINEYRGVYVVNWDGQWFYLTQNNGWAEFGANSTYDPIPEDIWF